MKFWEKQVRDVYCMGVLFTLTCNWDGVLGARHAEGWARRFMLANNIISFWNTAGIDSQNFAFKSFNAPFFTDKIQNTLKYDRCLIYTALIVLLFPNWLEHQSRCLLTHLATHAPHTTIKSPFYWYNYEVKNGPDIVNILIF